MAEVFPDVTVPRVELRGSVEAPEAAETVLSCAKIEELAYVTQLLEAGMDGVYGMEKLVTDSAG